MGVAVHRPSTEMSSATPSHPDVLTTDDRSIAAALIDRFVYGVRATAFWSAAVLPLFVIVGLATGAGSQYPSLLVAALVFNVVCAVVGHSHTPGR